MRSGKKTRNELLSAMVVYGFLNYEDGKVRIPNKELMDEFAKTIREKQDLGYIHRLAWEGKGRTMSGENLNFAGHTAYIGLGSNIGDCEGYLTAALNRLSRHPQIEVERVSAFRRTKPVGPVEQPDFLNACAKLRTSLAPMELLAVLQKLEQEAGRTREVHWGPRTLDLDMLLYDDVISDDKTLTLPHPEMHKRLFVLEPMCEIAPEAVHPRLGKRMEDLRADLMDGE